MFDKYPVSCMMTLRNIGNQGFLLIKGAFGYSISSAASCGRPLSVPEYIPEAI